MENQRQSNFELCRIVTMLLVMVLHTAFPTFELETTSLYIKTLAGFSVVGVNVFVLITGYFSATPKKTSLFNLFFICFFWMAIGMVVKIILGYPVDWTSLFFITKSNWFVVNYIGLLFFAPILNNFCEAVSKRALWGGVFSLLIIQTWFDWLPPYPFCGLGSNRGYSLISFIILYLLARAIKIYGLPNWFKKISPLGYLLCSIVLIVTSHCFRLPTAYIFAYNNPLVIISSVSFLISFEHINISSALINHIAKSTLACLLGHTVVFVLYKNLFIYIFEHFSNIQMVACWFVAVLIIFCIIVIIDQLRLMIYKPLDKKLRLVVKCNTLFH